jgi:peroxiredoxin
MRVAGMTAMSATGGVLLTLTCGCSMRDKPPEFQFTLLDGSRRSSESLRGRVTLVNFWATTCAICVAEMPDWVALYRQLQPTGGFDVLAVAMRHDPPARVAHFAETRALPFGVVIDNTGEVARAFDNVSVTPSLFLLDKQGHVAQRYTGRVEVSSVLKDITAISGRA